MLCVALFHAASRRAAARRRNASDAEEAWLPSLPTNDSDAPASEVSRRRMLVAAVLRPHVRPKRGGVPTGSDRAVDTDGRIVERPSVALRSGLVPGPVRVENAELPAPPLTEEAPPTLAALSSADGERAARLVSPSAGVRSAVASAGELCVGVRESLAAPAPELVAALLESRFDELAPTCESMSELPLMLMRFERDETLRGTGRGDAAEVLLSKGRSPAAASDGVLLDPSRLGPSSDTRRLREK